MSQAQRCHWRYRVKHSGVIDAAESSTAVSLTLQSQTQGQRHLGINHVSLKGVFFTLKRSCKKFSKLFIHDSHLNGTNKNICMYCRGARFRSYFSAIYFYHTDSTVSVTPWSHGSFLSWALATFKGIISQKKYTEEHNWTGTFKINFSKVGYS